MLPDEADRLLAGHFAIINLWRSIAGVVETMPLAFCDSTTVKADDLVSVERVAKDRVGELQMAKQWVDPHELSGFNNTQNSGSRDFGAAPHPLMNWDLQMRCG